MRLLLDMNLSPEICPKLVTAGHEAVHWSTLGERTASDDVIMKFARDEGFIVLTHDLDFGTLLAKTHSVGPSVLQIRVQDVLEDAFVALINSALNQFKTELSAGALVVIEEKRSRARILPIQ